jgi:hypothetical protein
MNANAETKVSGSRGLSGWRDRVGKKRRRGSISKRRQATKLGYLRMLARELSRELCSLARRSRVLLIRGEVPFLDLGPTYRPRRDSGLLVECTRTRGRIACMQEIREERPRLSMGEMQLVLKGFDLGAEWTQNNPHFCIQHTEVGRRTQISCGTDLSRTWRGSF